MNFTELLQTDSEAAKEAILDMLNTKAFELLDNYELSEDSIDEEFDVEEFTDDDEEFDETQIDEDAGNLKSLTRHLIKVAAKQGGGQNSQVTDAGPITSKMKAYSAIKNSLDAGHIPVVHINGKPHMAAHSMGYNYSRQEYQAHTGDKQVTNKETIYPKPRRIRGRMEYSKPFETTNDRYSKGDTLNKLIPSDDKEFYKTNKVEVKSVHPDEIRARLQKERAANKPKMQDNTVKMTDAEKAKARTRYNDSKVTSRTPAGDNLEGIKDAAAIRLAKIKLGNGKSSQNIKAMELHTELGKHLASGNTGAAREAAHALISHIHQHGLTTNDDKIKDYADTLKDLKNANASRWGSKSFHKDKLAKMRNESVDETELLIEELEELCHVMLDVNEAVVAGSVKKDKDGNVLSFKTVSDKKHGVVPGSVKKDKNGNVLSFKTESTSEE